MPVFPPPDPGKLIKVTVPVVDVKLVAPTVPATAINVPKLRKIAFDVVAIVSPFLPGADTAEPDWPPKAATLPDVTTILETDDVSGIIQTYDF